MALKLPKVPAQDGIGKLSALLQLICFLVLFVGIYLLLRRVVHAWFLRVAVLLADYFVVSIVTYLIIKPAAQKLEDKLRKS